MLDLDLLLILQSADQPHPYSISRMVIVPGHGLKGAFIRGEITEMKRLSIYPQIKSAHSGYRDKAIGFMSIQH